MSAAVLALAAAVVVVPLATAGPTGSKFSGSFSRPLVALDESWTQDPAAGVSAGSDATVSAPGGESGSVDPDCEPPDDQVDEWGCFTMVDPTTP